MKKYNIYILIVLLTATPWIVYLLFFYQNKLIISTDIWGQFGGFIGGVTAALTLPLTIVFVYKTYLSQKKVERISLEQLTLNKIDSYFFELLRTFNEYRFNQMKFSVKEGKGEKEWILGSSFFVHKRRQIQQKVEAGIGIKTAYNETIDMDNLHWEYYLRSLNAMIDWIDKSTIKETEKVRYLNLLKNSLTNDEMYFVKNINHLKYTWGIETLENQVEYLTSDINFDYN